MLQESSDTRPRPGGLYSLGNRVVARLGYGAMQLRHYGDDLDGAAALLRQAIGLGVNHVDTAHFYGNGFVNKVIGKALGPDDRVLIASKIGADPDPGAKVPIKLAQRPEQLPASVDDNLVSLRVEQIPIVYLRRTDLGPGLAAEGDQILDADDQMAEMIAVREEGKIGAIGLSGVGLNVLRQCAPAGIACVQNAYSLVSRELEEMLSFCIENGIAWVPFFPLGGSAAGCPKIIEHPTVLNIASRIGALPPQVGLAWLLGHAANILLIPGTADQNHLRENVDAASIFLDEQMMAELDSIAWPDAEARPE